MTRIAGLAGLALAAAAVAGCSTEISRGNIERAGIPTNFSYAASRGEMWTVVIGNPFRVPDPILESAVVGAMQGNYYGPRTQFTTRPSPAADPNYRIVVDFAYPPVTLPDAVCNAMVPQSAGYPVGGRVEMLVAFCIGQSLQSWVRMSAVAAGPEDPAFRRMIANAMVQLIPPYDPFPSRGDDCRGGNCT